MSVMATFTHCNRNQHYYCVKRRWGSSVFHVLVLPMCGFSPGAWETFRPRIHSELEPIPAVIATSHPTRAGFTLDRLHAHIHTYGQRWAVTR